jgi:site-specific DNA-methyltransferase (adenine-specific)
MISEVHNIDCMEFMATLPDKFFDLAIVDPPYGLNDMTKNSNGRHRNNITSYRNKSIPDAAYFQMLYRVSNRTIIWGCQYMMEFMVPVGSFIVWDKVYADPDLHNMSSCDIAWYSKLDRIRTFRYAWCGAIKQGNEQTIHPHQKPIPLYTWLLKNYAKPGDKIFDSHMGSQSSRIAAYDMGFDYWGCEVDKDYFDSGCKRFEQFKSQMKIFQ